MELRSKILVVDDSPATIIAVRSLLGKKYRLREATTGEGALDIADSFAPDLILLDIMMPGIDGYEVCRRVRANRRLSHTKVIMVSAATEVSGRLESYEAGADDYLTKPFNAEELLAKVKVHLRLKSVEELDQLKSDVLELLYRETQTPLNGVIEATELLASFDSMDGDERKMFATIANKNALRLHQLFEQVIHLCSLKAGAFEFHLDRNELAAIVQDAVSQANEHARKQDIRILQKLGEPVTLLLSSELGHPVNRGGRRATSARGPFREVDAEIPGQWAIGRSVHTCSESVRRLGRN